MDVQDGHASDISLALIGSEVFFLSHALGIIGLRDILGILASVNAGLHLC